jgi:hypothetical protein
MIHRAQKFPILWERARVRAELPLNRNLHLFLCLKFYVLGYDINPYNLRNLRKKMMAKKQ